MCDHVFSNGFFSAHPTQYTIPAEFGQGMANTQPMA